MELIPILSLIIMVATVCTFILAVGAFYHYKSKERKRKTQQKPQPDFIQAELVTPGPYTGSWAADDYYRFNVPVRGRTPGRETEYAGGYERKFPAYSGSGYEKPGSTYKEKRTTGHKFMRYTAAGYLDPLTDKTAADKIRWR
jgi:hypothetical protein